MGTYGKRDSRVLSLYPRQMISNGKESENKIKVSVVVPVYNVEQFLPQCMESLIGQTLNEMEIICLDDGSTDRCAELLDQYAEKDSRIRVIHKQNEGCGATMNRGFAEAKGEYVGIVESDDFVDQNMFEKLYQCAKENDADVVKSNYYVYRGGESKETTTYPELDLTEGFYLPRRYTDMFFEQRIWAALYRRDFLEKNHITQNETPGASYQDVSFNFQVMSRAKRIYYMPKAFLHYRMDNPGSSIHSRSKTYALCGEMEHAETYLNEYCSEDAELYCILANIRFRLYQRDAIVRINVDDKYDFLQRALEEYKKDRELGRYVRSYWKDSEWDELNLVLNDPVSFLNRARLMIAEKNMNRELFLRSILMYTKVYVYGAGKVGSEVTGNLRAYGIYPAAVLVQCAGDNPNVLQGICIAEYMNSDIDRNGAVVLIALREELLEHVFLNLQRNGYKNIISMNEEKRALLSGYMPELSGKIQ